MSTELSTTSYALLGLLAIRPWTTYELAKQMDRALGLFWPRARSHLYAEPKRLVAAGLARSTTGTTGLRRRTVYTITSKGQEALEKWIPLPAAGPALEFEQLVKVFFAEHGTRDDLLRSLDSMRTWVEDHAGQGTGIPREYLERRGAYPERLPWLILVGKFLDDYEQMVDRWAEWAMQVVASWPDELADAEPDWQALREMATNAEDLAGRARARNVEPPEHQP